MRESKSLYDRAVRWAVEQTPDGVEAGQFIKLTSALVLGYMAGWRAAKRKADQPPDERSA